jgi:4-diphosphocytidyl-2-C-methyl-D-erythritol kinase
VGAGLGGGSSDAAAALRALVKLWELDIPRAELTRLAADLGADVPFFLSGPASFCTGIGEQIREISPQRYELVLWNPDATLSTADVYRRFDARSRPHRQAQACMAAYHRGDPYALAEQVWNNLAGASDECMPELAAMRAQCLDAGALAAWVSGSGPTIVSLCADARAARTCAAKLASLASRNAVIIQCHTLTSATCEL